MWRKLLASRRPAPVNQPVPALALPARPGRADALLQRLEWTVIRRLDGWLQGDYRSLMRGAGLDLADLREYQLHDDVRHIDWNVTARLQQPHVRVFTEDREMTAWFLLDLSPSVDFGSGHQRKRDVLQGFVAVLARLITRRGNRVGALFYGGPADAPSDIAMVPARSGRVHVLGLLHRMMAVAPAAERPHQAPTGAGVTRLAELLHSARHSIRSRSTVLVVSDFISEPGWEQPLGELARRHDVVAVSLVDPMERHLPEMGLITVCDAESGEQLLVDTSDRAFRDRFAQMAAQREAELQEALARAGVDALELSTDDDLADALLRFLALRRRRLGAMRPAPTHTGVSA